MTRFALNRRSRSTLAPALLALFAAGCMAAAPQKPKDPQLEWLESRSMLRQADQHARKHAATGELWRHPYANPQPRAASATASVWFTAYPAATITREKETVLRALGDEKLWKAFGEIGIKGMHTGPMKRSGGVLNQKYTPTIDGNFDRISMEIDPAFGSEKEYLALTRNARNNGAIVIGDIIPGHTGKGPDFRLAERGVGDYPGIFHMVKIDRKDWGLLPAVPKGRDSVNLKPDVVDQLKAKGYIVGQLPRTIFYEPGVKETDWSATAPVKGPDGVERRWVYLHYFKDGQPTLNWLDPTFAAQRLVMGDAMHSLAVLGEGMLRLDANGFLGIEADPKGGRAWSEGHPLSVTSNQIIAGLVRKMGGFTFQELNLTLEDIKAMSHGGADLTYDFVTRPAYHHALVTGDAEFLRMMLKMGRQYGIDPAGLIHALQNHDELTLELVHFWTLHKDDKFTFRGKELKGSELRDLIRAEVHGKAMGEAAPYNLQASNGISCTTATVAAAALGLKDISALSDADKAQIQKLHLLLAFYNAMQPGVFAMSGWDLVGALTLPGESVKALMADGDTRWINRGAYDLMGNNPAAKTSSSKLPRTTAIYGSLPEQLLKPESFASQLKKMLKVRTQYRINEATQLDLPAVKSKGLVVLLHELPDGGGLQVSAMNFGKDAVEETIDLKAGKAGAMVSDLMAGKAAGTLSGTRLAVKLAGHEAKAFLIQ